MNMLVRILACLSALLAVVPFLRPRSWSATALLWLPKVLAGALSPLLGLAGGLGAALGLARRDWKLAGAGVLGAGLAARFLADVPATEEQFEAAFGPRWQARVSAALLAAGSPAPAAFQRNVVVGQKPGSGRPLLADLWQPGAGAPRSGMGLIYAHGSGWRVGDKDLGTRHFFRRLAGQGHLVLDLAYSLWPRATIATMVAEVNQAVLWLKENGAAYGVDPARVVLMGGSAGGHLALLAAYAPDHPAFRPSAAAGDTGVCGVVAFYPPVDLLELYTQVRERAQAPAGPLDGVAEAMMDRLFRADAGDHRSGEREGEGRREGQSGKFRDMLPEMLGGEPDEVPETYRLLSPIFHAGPHCPPTLLLQGSDDLFGLAPAVRRLHHDLQAADVPAILVEFPHVEHGFDLLFPQVSPVARTAARAVERFLALLGSRPS